MVQVRGRPRVVLDAVGAGLFGAAGAWTLWARMQSAGSAAPFITLLAACGLVVIATRILGPGGRLIVPAAILVAAVLVVAGSDSSIVSTRALAGPLGYLNANGAFYVQAAIAGLMIASAAHSWPIRVLGVAVAVAFAVLPFIVHVLAAASLVVLLPVIAFACTGFAGPRGARVAVGVLGALFTAAVVVTIVVGATYSPAAPSTLQQAAADTVDRERVALWHDAFVIMREHPRTGVGPGQYQVVSPIGSRDRDFRWAHNEFLQQGAEGGIIGLGLLAALFVWGFVRLWVVRRPDLVTALGAASLAALGIHACVDYVGHFPAIPLTTAALVATGMLEGTTRPFGGWRWRALERDDLSRIRARS